MTVHVGVVQLKHCPFCGGEPSIVRGETIADSWPHGSFSRVYCTGCQIRQLFYRNDAEAVQAWNKRALASNYAITDEMALAVSIKAWELREEISHEEARRLIMDGKDRPHAGDCIDQPYTCLRCIYEDAKREGHAILSAGLAEVTKREP